MSSLPDPRVVLLQTGGAIYVLIRGMSNVEDGWKEVHDYLLTI